MDTRTCKYCGIEFGLMKFDDGTFEEGYCCKFHRKDHEKQLVKEGVIKIEHGNEVGILKDTNYRDINGERIWFPKDGRPYYDQALKRTFHTIQEKQAYMKEKKLFMDGSSNPNRWPIESGDNRSRSHRKTMRLED